MAKSPHLLLLEMEDWKGWTLVSSISNPWQVVVKPQPSHQKRKKKPFPIMAEQTEFSKKQVDTLRLRKVILRVLQNHIEMP